MSNKKIKTTPKPNKSTATSIPNPKPLKMDKIEREAKSVRQMEVYELNNEDSIKHYPIFPEGKINDMLKEYQQHMTYAIEKDILFPEEKTLDYIYFLCIKYFTSLEEGISDEYEKQILQMDYLIDTGYFRQIVNEVFMQSEINKVLDAITNLLSSYQLLEKLDTQIKKKTEDLEIRNKNMINVLADNPYPNITKKH